MAPTLTARSPVIIAALAGAALLVSAPAFAVITVVASPPSAYNPATASVGTWHFDESTGTIAADSSGLANTAQLTCLTAACVSTPTFVAGPVGFGSAVSFTGLADSLVRVTNTASYNFTDDLTVSAWVKPSTLSQPDRAGLVVRGISGSETFALDISGGLYRFMATAGQFAVSTNSIVAGTWTHLIGVYSSAGTATLYVNGRPTTPVTGLPLARSGVVHDISIGNRQSAAAAYDRGFLGSIDAVRVQHLALNAAQALAEYQGSFVSTISAPAPNNNIQIGLPPNAFSAAANLSVTVDPMTTPVAITPTILNAGLTVLPTGFTLVPNSLIEIVPYVAAVPFTQPLGSSATISMPYSDTNEDNIIDNTSPPLAASGIRVYTLNTTVNLWERLDSSIDPVSHRVIAYTPHFSVFAMFAPQTFGTALSQARVYPIPWKPGTGGRFDAAAITFDRLPTSGVIRILSMTGERIRELSFDGSSAGTTTWNGQTERGQRAASGVYFARVTGDDGSSAFIKFAIER